MRLTWFVEAPVVAGAEASLGGGFVTLLNAGSVQSSQRVVVEGQEVNLEALVAAPRIDVIASRILVSESLRAIESVTLTAADLVEVFGQVVADRTTGIIEYRAQQLFLQPSSLSRAQQILIGAEFVQSSGVIDSSSLVDEVP